MTRGVKNPLWYGIGSRLRPLRERLGLSHRQLAAISEVAQGTIGNIEADRRIAKLDSLERLACALGVPSVWLAYGPDGEYRFRQRTTRSPVPHDPPEPMLGAGQSAGLHKGVAERLRRAREARSLSMRELAQAAGVSGQTVSLTEAGETVPLVSNCEAFAVALDVSPGWLAFGIGEDFTASD